MVCPAESKKKEVLGRLLVKIKRNTFFSRLDHYALCPSYHSNTERSCL